MTPVRLIVGLGNPGHQYESTRHNAGFWWIDELAREQKLTFSNETKFHGMAARGKLYGHEVLLLKPSTFMNGSGRSVGAIALFYKIEPQEILVAHDELDLPPGTARLKFGGGHGGHNGLKDIIAHLGTKAFWRLRFGIGHPVERADVVNYVLKEPLQEDRYLINDAMKKASAVAHLVIEGKTEAAMQRLHTS